MNRPPKYALICLMLFLVTVLVIQAFRIPPGIKQPIAFPHKVHVANQMECVFCHDSAERSAVAGIPSVIQCMLCHQSINTDSPEIKKLASYAGRHEEVPWVRVYGFPERAAVRFSHKRHLKAGVECAFCHGDVAAAVGMRREIDWTMGGCIDCHRSKQASIDCLTCHR